MKNLGCRWREPGVPLSSTGAGRVATLFQRDGPSVILGGGYCSKTMRKYRIDDESGFLCHEDGSVGENLLRWGLRLAGTLSIQGITGSS